MPNSSNKDKRSLLPYGDSTLSPPISSSEKEVSEWKDNKDKSSDKYFITKYKEIVKEMEDLKESFDVNKRMENVEIRFTPVFGAKYYLYKRENNTLFLSIIGPSEWKRDDLEYSGCYTIDSNSVWREINE
jgi:hypothetical protein